MAYVYGNGFGNYNGGDPEFSGFDGLFSKIGSALKKVGTKVGQTLAAPIVVPTAMVAKATTHVLAQTGAKPLQKLNSAVNKVYQSSDAVALRGNYAAQVGTGAAVAVTVATGGSGAAIVASALPGAISIVAGKPKPTIGTALSTFAQGAVAGAVVGASGNVFEAGAQLVQTAASGVKAAAPVAAPAASVPVVAEAPVDMGTLPPGTQPAGRGGAIGPLAGAGVGFVAGGPVGAAVGAVAGYFLTKPKG